MATNTSTVLNPTEMLAGDHERVSRLFEDYQNMESRAGRRTVLLTIANELEVHAGVEESEFYPALRELGGDGAAFVAEALKEHARIKSLVQRVKHEDPESEVFRSTFADLSETVLAHAQREERDAFPIANARLPLEKLGARMAARKAVLMAVHPTPPMLGVLAFGIMALGAWWLWRR
jgi:iron-sulfur cluster repair protein YtfE (RIC family)